VEVVFVSGVVLMDFIVSFKDTCMFFDDVADWWEIIHGSLYELICQKLHFYKVFAELISRELRRI